MGSLFLAIVICSVIILESDFSDKGTGIIGHRVDEYVCMLRKVWGRKPFPKGRKTFNLLKLL